MLNVVTVRVGSKYDMDYSAKAHDMIARNLSTRDDVRHWEITDDPHACPDGVTPIAHNRDLPGWWQKVYLFSPDMPWAVGERVFYMDLDCLVVGALEELVERKGIIQDQFWPCFNSSVMVWDHGEHHEIWEGFANDANACMNWAWGKVPKESLPEGAINGGDQEWISIVDDHADVPWETFPPDWCVSYLDAKAWPPQGCKIVVFHGANKPHNQPKDSWIWDVWKVGGFTSLPTLSGMNVTHDHALDNIRENIKLDVDWFTGMPEHSKTAVLVCGGPSMKDHIREIRDHKQRGARIITVNNALRYLMSMGIKPDHHIILDARADNASFLQDAPEGVRYFLASQVDPSLFAALRADRGRYDVIMWHSAMDAVGEAMLEIIEPVSESRRQSLVMVPGGCTVGLRALWLLWGSGYRKVHVYGMDSSYAGGEGHAYAQPMNDGESTLEVVMGGNRYVCAPWMARQANEFQAMWPELLKAGLRLWVHGTGLIPDMFRSLRAQKEAA